MSTRALRVLTLVLMIATGCQAPRTPEPMAGPVATPNTIGSADTDSGDEARGPVEGVATYRERIKMPPGASLRVEAVNASGRIVATTTIRDVAGPPIPFSIATPRTGVSLRAMLDGPDGERWFETPAPVAVIASGGRMELLMKRSTGVATSGPPLPSAVAHWECGEFGVMSRLDGGTLRLAYNGHSRTLAAQGIAGDLRYRDAAGNAFALIGPTATLTLAGEPARDCVRATQPSPWNRAVLDGAVFRAVGNEPGWHAHIVGSPPMLKASLDYGEHVLDTPVRVTATGYQGKELMGKPLRMQVHRAPCRDAMSGQVFEATVTLEALGRTYTGCGANLRD